MGCSSTSRLSVNNQEIIADYRKFLEVCKKGAKLVVLDDDIIDVSEFINLHPGGTVMIQKYIGIFVNMINKKVWKLVDLYMEDFKCQNQ